MKYNKVAPWEGRLVWVGTPRSGTSRNGNDWKQVDFTLEYTDEDKVKHITFSLFGIEKVDKLLSIPHGTMLHVKWAPESRENGGRWWPSFSAYEVESAETAPAPTVSNPEIVPAEKQEEEGGDEDLPF